MNNCYCNICGQLMYSPKPISGSNFCCSGCKRINRLPQDPKKRMEHYDRFVRKANDPVGLVMYTQPAQRVVGQSYHPSRNLRIRGTKRQRLTTKREQSCSK